MTNTSRNAMKGMSPMVHPAELNVTAPDETLPPFTTLNPMLATDPYPLYRRYREREPVQGRADGFGNSRQATTTRPR